MHTVPQGQWYRGGVHVFYEGSWHVQLNFGVVSVSVSERVPEEYLTYCCSIQQYPGKTCYTLDSQVNVENIGEDASKKGLFQANFLFGPPNCRFSGFINSLLYHIKLHTIV